MQKNQLEKIWQQVPADYYEKGMKKNILQRFWHSQKILNIKQMIGNNPRDILDIGCASGYVCAEIKNLFPKAKVTGIDASETFIKFAKKTHKGVDFLAADGHNMPFKDKTFDLIVCTEVLEHVVEPKKILAEAKRCLKNNGELIVSMDSGSFLFSLIWFFWTKLGRGKVWKDAHIHTFKGNSLKKMLESVGFKIKEGKKSHFGMAIFLKAQKQI